MLDQSHFIIREPGAVPRGRRARFQEMFNILEPKMASYLRLLSTKNAINRASDYHYLNLNVTQSTDPVNGLDYIHPVVAPSVDYAVSVICKSLLPNGVFEFEFKAENPSDEPAARQSSLLVKRVLNQDNDAYRILNGWAQDACLHKNGIMMIAPVSRDITMYREVEGTLDNLRVFEIIASERGMDVRQQSRTEIAVDPQTLMQAGENISGDVISERATEDILNAVNQSKVYRARYKLTGRNTSVKYVPVAQHYWICDPTVTSIQDQPFCGFYKPMTIQEATELYPGLDLELFEKYAEFSNVGAYQAGSLINNLALHARDSVPINGLPTQGSANNEAAARQVTVITAWNRYDIDGDGELELVEVVYSGSYIISAREVEFIPVANMCPRPLPQNFYGYSIAERMVPMQEYATAIHRAELQMAMYASTPRIGVNPEFVDLEQLQDGESSIFVLDRKFDPNLHIWEPQPLQGNLGYVQDALQRLREDTMSMLGMTQPGDMFNPEVMAAGNSGLKLQLALSPNQLIQDAMVKNCAQGVRELIYLTWRTLIQYGGDFNIQKTADQVMDNWGQGFLDYNNAQEMMIADRQNIELDLAVGYKSEENRVQRQALIIQTQQGFAQAVVLMQQSGLMTPEMLKKARRPFEDTLYTLGIKNTDEYLPTTEELQQAFEISQQAAAAAPPPAEELAKQARAELDKAKTIEIQRTLDGETYDQQLETLAIQRDPDPNYN